MEPVHSTRYWQDRLKHVILTKQPLHQSIFRCSLDKWKLIEAKHKEILAKHIKPDESVLDCGCGYGRLLTLMPSNWNGPYMGVDISPDFIDLAIKRNPEKPRLFLVGSLMDLDFTDGVYDWAILISIRPMIKREMGSEVWEQMETQIRLHSKKRLYLEYDETEEGYVE